jgi:Uma2 family endonuclease
MNTTTRSYIEQTDPPRPPKETLPTMYDLPSEDPEEPGLPDEFHSLQPQLLSATLRLMDVVSDRSLGSSQGLFTAHDMNLYYDSKHPLWHKRPDWFAVIGVSRLYEDRDMRLSYVVWQEGVNPFVVVELLSPGTEKEDLGQTEATPNQPPTKWDVYERILRIPYYILFDRYSNSLRAYQLNGGQYQALIPENDRIWIPELKMSLGVWQGRYQGIERLWLRWLDSDGNWIPTDTEMLETEQQQREQAQQQLKTERQQREQAEQQRDEAQQRAEYLAERLKALGINPEEEG